VKKDGARYFGPSPALVDRETLGIVNRHFQHRTCTDSVMANRRRPACSTRSSLSGALRVQRVAGEYRRSVDEVALFLEWQGRRADPESRGA